MSDLIDPSTIKAVVTGMIGASIGAVFKTLMKPEASFRKWLVQIGTSFIVGTLLGLGSLERFGLDQSASIVIAVVGTILSEQIVSFIMVRGEKLKAGKIDISMEGDR